MASDDNNERTLKTTAVVLLVAFSLQSAVVT